MKRWLLCSISSKVYPRRDSCPEHGTSCSIYVVPEVADVWPLRRRIQQLKHLREIAIDVEACLEPGGPVPEFMRLAFADAITRTGEAPEKEGEGES